MKKFICALSVLSLSFSTTSLAFDLISSTKDERIEVIPTDRYGNTAARAKATHVRFRYVKDGKVVRDIGSRPYNFCELKAERKDSAESAKNWANIGHLVTAAEGSLGGALSIAIFATGGGAAPVALGTVALMATTEAVTLTMSNSNEAKSKSLNDNMIRDIDHHTTGSLEKTVVTLEHALSDIPADQSGCNETLLAVTERAEEPAPSQVETTTTVTVKNEVAISAKGGN